MYDCITIGDIKLDTFVEILDAKVKGDRLCLEYGKKIPARITSTQIAGSAPNVATALAKMKLKTAVFSVMGKDRTYELARAQMIKKNIDTHYIQTTAKMNSSSSIVINFKGEKTILASAEPFKYRLPKFEKTNWIYICELGRNYKELYSELIKKVSADHVHIAMNPGAHQIDERDEILYKMMKTTTLLFLNVEEARHLTRTNKVVPIKKLLLNSWKLNNKNVVVTDGKKGAYGYDGHTSFYLPMFPGKRVEATGAGDSFAAATLAGKMKGMTLAEAMAWGAVNSASVVGFIGPTAGLLSETEIKKRLQKHPSFKAEII